MILVLGWFLFSQMILTIGVLHIQKYFAYTSSGPCLPQDMLDKDQEDVFLLCALKARMEVAA